MSAPNLVFVFADQMRYQAQGYAGNPDVRTPYLDRLAAESLTFTHAISGCPVCSPARASLITGRYPLAHGVWVNDAELGTEATSLAQAFQGAGYATAYIGKWHLDGHGARSAYIPQERRQGYDYWKVLECSHRYHDSPYYAGDDPTLRRWEGYDAIAQTRDAQTYIRHQAGKGPFHLMLSWGPPHNPYDTAPGAYRRLYDPDQLTLRPNVPPELEEPTRLALAGYYAHISALDALIGELLETIRECGIEGETLFCFWSDHGDMLGSQGEQRKQWPYDESIRVPLIIRCPAMFQRGRSIPAVINTPDLLPTLLDLCGISIPQSADGRNYGPYLRGEEPAPTDAALLACYHPFGEFARARGGREYRGLRTAQHTYVRALDGPWLLFDNQCDPYQRLNLVGRAELAGVQADLDARLLSMLAEQRDAFEPSAAYVSRWGRALRENGAMWYTP